MSSHDRLIGKILVAPREYKAMLVFNGTLETRRFDSCHVNYELGMRKNEHSAEVRMD